MFGSEYEDDEVDEKTTLSVIKDLMEQLVGEMKPTEDDFAERLGRKKPDLEVMKIGVGVDEEPMEKEGMEDEMAMMEEEMSPEDKLKKRLMKLRA